MNTITYTYTTKKGEVKESFNFDTQVQIIKTSVKTSTYTHADSVTTAFYLSELLRELRTRNIDYSQKTSGGSVLSLAPQI